MDLSSFNWGLKGPLGKRPGEEGMEAVLGGQCWVSFFAGSPSPSLCPQNVERLLENIGIKVGCLGTQRGADGSPMGQIMPTGPGQHMGGCSNGCVLLTPHCHSDVCTAGNCGDLG